jgi:F-type H+-transporting ATPase subunit b
MNLIDIRLVGTQILGFLLMLWALRKWAWGPLVGMLEKRREKIEGDFREADRVKAEAEALKVSYEQKLRGADTEARSRIQSAVEEGQRVAAEIKSQAQTEATQRLARAEDEVAREREKAKEQLKDQKLDDPAQRKLASEFVDEVGALQ